MAINVLSPRIYNRIAAGEVVEKPASVVKELVENSLDAGATKIRIEIEGGGIEKISIMDNGCGIAKEDLPLAFLPHATSKISSLDDLNGIETLGFRGEALASIASVARVELTTKQKGQDTGFKIEANGGEISKVSEVARLDGTTLTVRNLFYNTPVRAKFLRKPKIEESEITHLVEKFMLARPEIDFVYVVDGKEIYNHYSGTLEEVIYLLYGREIHSGLLPLNLEEKGISVTGFIVSPKYSKPNRTYQSLFVNNRFVENYMVSACVQGAFEGVLMKGRYPIYVIKLQVPFDRVDVNVHPNKREVKFDDNSQIFGIIRRAVERALLGANLIAEFEVKEKEEWSKFSIHNEKEPARTGFDSYQKSTIDKISADEGASYQIKVDHDERKFITPQDLKKNGIEVINIPDFSSVKSDENHKNKPNGRLFFNQFGDGILNEVEISVEKNANDNKVEISVEKNANDNKVENSSKNVEESSAEKRFVEEKFLKTDAETIKIIGVVFKTYIITEFDDSVYIIDQHAMHERQNYDRLKAEIEKKNIAKQGLLVPFEVNLLAKDREIFAEKLENLKEIGFDIEQDGQKFIIKSVPFVLSSINFNNFVEEILQDESIRKETASGLINEKLCQTACKHSIRAGDSVSKEEIFYLINKIKDGVPLCPHGRPIIVKITRKELEKMFKRTL